MDSAYILSLLLGVPQKIKRQCFEVFLVEGFQEDVDELLKKISEFLLIWVLRQPDAYFAYFVPLTSSGLRQLRQN